MVTTPERLLTTAEAAQFLSRAENTLRIDRIHGRGPAYRKIGRSVRYSMSDLLAYVDLAKRTRTNQAA